MIKVCWTWPLEAEQLEIQILPKSGCLIKLELAERIRLLCGGWRGTSSILLDPPGKEPSQSPTLNGHLFAQHQSGWWPVQIPSTY